MPNVIFNSFKRDVGLGLINLGSDPIKMMLTNGYTPNKDTHAKRSDVTGEITGTGYTAGGVTLPNKTYTQNNTNDTAVLDADDVTIANSSLTADGAVLYKSRGGASSADELIMYVDLGGTITSTNSDFIVPWHASGILIMGDA